MPEAPKAVALLSGGLDSATATAIARDEGLEVYALSFAYGQRQSVELDAARRVAASLGVARHHVTQIDLGAFGGSALTDEAIEVPKSRGPAEIGDGIPVTYVPARNTIFLSFALGWAEVLGATDIFLGINAVDYSGYPDCRPAFLETFQQLARLATRSGVEGRPVRLRAPLIELTKAEIIKRGTALGVDYALTHSCYDPEGALACGTCDACILRREGFAAANVPDPTHYVKERR